MYGVHIYTSVYEALSFIFTDKKQRAYRSFVRIKHFERFVRNDNGKGWYADDENADYDDDDNMMGIFFVYF